MIYLLVPASVEHGKKGESALDWGLKRDWANCVHREVSRSLSSWPRESLFFLHGAQEHVTPNSFLPCSSMQKRKKRLLPSPPPKVYPIKLLSPKNTAVLHIKRFCFHKYFDKTLNAAICEVFCWTLKIDSFFIPFFIVFFSLCEAWMMVCYPGVCCGWAIIE